MAKGDVIVLGGTGFLGHRVVRKLLERGHSVAVGTRFPEKIARHSKIWGREVRPVKVDLLNDEVLSRALDGAGTVINCIGFYVETRDQTFWDVHVDAACKIADAVEASGTCKLIHISGIGASPMARSAYVRARGEGDEAVRSACANTIILRPSVLFSRSGAFFGDLDAIIRMLPIVPLFGTGGTRLQPVFVGDVAEAICEAADQTDNSGAIYELGGPDVFSYREIVTRLAARSGRRRLLLPVPFPIWWLLADLASHLPRPPVTSGQVDLMQRDNIVATSAKTFADLSIVPKSATSLDLV
ncbi:complex I NDUFA9 subunit family protein [Labrenzia sp. PHM005]|uniref:complex I NDUFA9 subunit family protein n=1 Tax=Labrenzia sp. PHM005 TaxID=2590016 RepID=UPI0011408589|nr:complex I NDUFA9 subunit family protein [Labrenzia sp. PHM005]QDG75812.1 complex I NDUFA9 subunit family protein [Labrenzia sp. PHM005]